VTDYWHGEERRRSYGPRKKRQVESHHPDCGGASAGHWSVGRGDLNAKKDAIFEPLTPPFVVNYNVNGRQRYMQVSITLLARDHADLEALKAHMPVIRNNLVMMFSGQPFDTIATPVGMEMLRQKAAAVVQEVGQKELSKSVIEQVLFTNYVLQ
jgi:flagellar FliL protein